MKEIDDIVIITTEETCDNSIVEICRKNNMPYFRGNSTDLLDRHYQANRVFKADVVVKIPSDCPLADPNIADRVIEVIKKCDVIDYVSNYHPPTFPDGLDVEAARANILERAWKLAKKHYEREHTFPFIWDNPSEYNIANIINAKGNHFMSHRWTLDYEEDWKFLLTISEMCDLTKVTDYKDILSLLDANCWISKINSCYNGVNWYRNHHEQLSTISNDLYKHED
jgi:spore coat polysaccharide biosynthesis protein SpsF